MSKINDGGAAFPTTYGQFPGMSLRDWFAGQTMSGWLASLGPEEFGSSAGVANFAYKIADAMLAARSGGQDDE